MWCSPNAWVLQCHTYISCIPVLKCIKMIKPRIQKKTRNRSLSQNKQIIKAPLTHQPNLEKLENTFLTEKPRFIKRIEHSSGRLRAGRIVGRIRGIVHSFGNMSHAFRCNSRLGIGMRITRIVRHMSTEVWGVGGRAVLIRMMRFSMVQTGWRKDCVQNGVTCKRNVFCAHCGTV